MAGCFGALARLASSGLSAAGAVFLDVAKAFDTVWIDGLLYKLTLLNGSKQLVIWG